MLRSSQGELSVVPLPSDDVWLHNGDRLHVLSSVNGLNEQALMAAGNALFQISGLKDLSQCRNLIANLPASVDLFLYDYQADRLSEELNRYLLAELLPM